MMPVTRKNAMRTDRHLRLLAIDDSSDDAELMLGALRRGGYLVTHQLVDTETAMRAALESHD